MQDEQVCRADGIEGVNYPAVVQTKNLPFEKGKKRIAFNTPPFKYCPSDLLAGRQQRKGIVFTLGDQEREWPNTDGYSDLEVWSETLSRWPCLVRKRFVVRKLQ